MRNWIASVLLVGTMGVASSAAAQEQADMNATRFGFHFGLGVGGEAHTSYPGVADPAGSDLDPSIALGLRLDAPKWKYLALGSLVQIDFPKGDDVGDRAARFDFDLLVRPRVVLHTSAGPLELYGLVPIGFTVALPRDAIPLFDTGFGWNLGVLAGAQFFFHPRVGILFELGWMRHDSRHDNDVPFVDGKAQIVTNQAIMNFGVSVIL
jgi:hypothetical protein